MLVSGIEHIKKYIPQREPIIMVDSIEEVTDNSGVTGLTIASDNLFVQNSLLRESGMVEHIAQSAAANMGYRLSLLNKPVPLGFIAAIKNLSIIKMPSVGDRIMTKILISNQVLDITITQCAVFLNNEEIAKCEMRIFLNSENK